MGPGTKITPEEGGDAGGGRLVWLGDAASARKMFRRPSPNPWSVAHPLQPIQCFLYENPQTMRPPGAFHGSPVSLCSSCQARSAAARGEPCITRPTMARSFGRRWRVSIEYPFPLGGKNVKDPITES